MNSLKVNLVLKTKSSLQIQVIDILAKQRESLSLVNSHLNKHKLKYNKG